MIPLIDLSRSRDDVAVALADALEHVGFFIVVNHGVPRDLVRRTFAEAERFHAQPQAAKHAVLMNEHNNGYMAMARLQRADLAGERGRAAGHERGLLRQARARTGRSAGGAALRGDPTDGRRTCRGFRETVLDYCEAVDRLAVSVLPALSLSLGLPEGWFAPHFTRSQFSFRLSHYPPAKREPGRYGIAPHTDVNFNDLPRAVGRAGICRSGAGRTAGRTCPSSRTPSSSTPATCCNRWTNGRYRSDPAPRVAASRAPPFTRSPIFFGPNPGCGKSSCAPTCTGPRRPAALALRS